VLNKVYELIQPRQFEIVYKDMSLKGNRVIVHPTYLSICNADQRYYQGLRSKSALAQKLPMALIHEAIGCVIYDPTKTFKPNDTVVLIPNMPTESSDIIAENYLRSSRFRASGFDGFLQEYISLAPDRAVKLPDGMNPYVASFTELVSVSYHAISRFMRFSHIKKEKIGIWGDGNLGYITALLLRYIFPDCELHVFGVNAHKLKDFSFAHETHIVYDVENKIFLDHAFECVGGGGASSAINQAIDLLHPEATISIMGVSEEAVPINTRMVLEKGLRIFGSSRSGREDFIGLLDLYEKHPRIVNHLEKIIGAKVTIRHTADIKRAFEMDISKAMGKTIMIWI